MWNIFIKWNLKRLLEFSITLNITLFCVEDKPLTIPALLSTYCSLGVDNIPSPLVLPCKSFNILCELNVPLSIRGMGIK